MKVASGLGSVTLTTAVQPAIIAGPTFCGTAGKAKLYAGNAATTPIGSCTTRLAPAIGMMLPPSEPAASGPRSLSRTCAVSRLRPISAL